MTRHLFTIDPSQPFLDALVDGIWRQADQDVFKLSQYLIFLPTRRACRALRQVFLERTGRQALLLPRMQPLGDIDEEELYFSAGQIFRDGDSLPPAISPLRRQLLLTQLVKRKDHDLPLEQAAHLARALGQLLDQVQIEGLDLSNLANLVKDRELAEHWQETVEFLKILTEAWPRLLAAQGFIDPADHRNRVIRAQAEAWRRYPPSFPVIAAGSTGTVPATAELLDVISTLPQGCVILPGLDYDLDTAAWQAIGETHPQYAMKSLLEKMAVQPASVRVWDKFEGSNSRPDILRHAMRPADVTDDWQDLRHNPVARAAPLNLFHLAADHPQEEAQAIALIMRQVLETPGKTATLVTPDRDLAERTCAALARWDIAVNDSAGASLATRPIGAFLRDILAAAQPDAGAVAMLSLLKHPFTACGLAPSECRRRAREVELTVWRTEQPAASDWLAHIHSLLQPVTANWQTPKPLTGWIEGHIHIAEAFARSDEQTGPDRLWHGTTGERAAEWFDEWRRSGDGFPDLTGADYAGLFSNLLRNVTVRPAYGQHPRLNILGPLEARLLHADVMILGGLNEGIWPSNPAVDPWMSRPMKQDFRLPSPDRRIGLAAHDFVQLACGSDTVYLTRSSRVGTAPAVPSRFLLQLHTVLRAIGLSDETHDALTPVEPWLNWTRQLDAPDRLIEIAPPAPRPALNLRPQKFSVTEIATWRHNPYATYAKKILRLRKLDPLDADFDAGDRGTMIHAALEKFVAAYPAAMPPDALALLLDIGRQVFAPALDRPEIAAFWWPRFERIAAWFVPHEAARRAAGIMPEKIEASGQITFGHINLNGRADRIDRLADGRLAIVDYKTGAVPLQTDVTSGAEPQLPLLALIAGQGGFMGLPAAEVGALAYWKLDGGREAAKETGIAFSADLVDRARAGLQELIAAYDNADMPYLAVPKPGYAPRYNDYAHLARMAEWGRFEVDE